MVAAFPAVDVLDQQFSFFMRNTVERGAVWALAVEIPFKDFVRFYLAGDSLRFSIFLGKGPFVELAFDLVNPLCFLMHRCEQQTLPCRGPTI